MTLDVNVLILILVGFGLLILKPQITAAVGPLVARLRALIPSGKTSDANVGPIAEAYGTLVAHARLTGRRDANELLVDLWPMLLNEPPREDA